MAATAKRRWYQFSLKTMLVAMAAVGVALGTYNRMNFLRKQAEFHEQRGFEFAQMAVEVQNDIEPGHAEALAKHHRVLGERYSRAVYYPWAIVHEPPEPAPMKFSIRDLFLVTVIVAILVAWWQDHRQISAEAQNEISKEREYRRTLVDIKWPVPGLEGYKRIWGEPAPNPPKK